MIVRVTILGRDAKVELHDAAGAEIVVAHDARPVRGVGLLARSDGVGAARVRERVFAS